MKIDNGLELVRSSNGRRWLWRTTRERLYSQSEGVGVRRDLSVPFPMPQSKVPVEVRPLRPTDDLSLIADAAGLDPAEAQMRADQRWILSANVENCWVGVDPEGTVCVMTFLFTSKDNARIQARWRGELPELRSDEALIEGSFVAESHRAVGVAPHVVARVVEQASVLDARYVYTYMAKENIGAQKAAAKIGFKPYVERQQSWFLFRRRFRFLPVAEWATVSSA